MRFGSAVILQTDGTHRIDNSRDEMTTNARGPSMNIFTNCYTLKQKRPLQKFLLRKWRAFTNTSDNSSLGFPYVKYNMRS